MPGDKKNTFSGWILGLITPETFIKMFVLLCGFSLSTGYFLNKASSSISDNAAKDVAQDIAAAQKHAETDGSISELEYVVMGLVISNAETRVSMNNVDRQLIEIKEMIRNIGR